MCGITGIVAFNEIGRFNMINLNKATEALAQRGPDDHGLYQADFVAFGHRRLSILDTSQKGHQPMQVPEGRYVIAFNGEIYNYKALRKELVDKGVSFYTETDTEVLLQLYTHEGKSCLNKLNGFFCFAIYDTKEKTVFIARDRMGIKPLVYYQDEDKFIFASEMKSVLAYGLDPEINPHALRAYFELNYIPAPLSILKGFHKLMPGQYLEIAGSKVTKGVYYQINETNKIIAGQSYEDNQKLLKEKLHESVQKRLVSDVPLGSFLSGGIDSSVIVALASRDVDKLNTFSIGYKDQPFFDETHYAQLVANKFDTEHTVFSLGMDDLYGHLEDIVNYFDEPFADSSAIPVNILSKETAKHMTVALSGDGADEIFSGYNKHSAWLRSEANNLQNTLIAKLHPLLSHLPKSRSNPISNKIRQLEKYGHGLTLDRKERYWTWACISKSSEVNQLLQSSWHAPDETYMEHRDEWLGAISNYKDFNDFLRNDTELVLPNDMLAKVDLMSMANGLEVRVPFLDHNIVEFAFSLSPDQKINSEMRKRILQDTFRDLLPAELYKRPKKGFEVPLLSWLKKGLGGDLNKYVFDRDFTEAQGIFNPNYLVEMQTQLYSSNPGDVHAKLWAIYVFQKWYNKYLL